MGSGETSPTMVKTHRDNIAKLSGRAPLSVILDTPFGFQSNADDISQKAREYFKVSVNIDIDATSFRSQNDPVLEKEKFFSTLDRADFVFSGPGSPTYALRQWKDTPVPQILADKLLRGPGLVTFSSAAALTLGKYTIPVYEIYKVGQEPDWEIGLDLLGAIGIHGAVIPHFNNAEGGNHDTRFCYLGEDRLLAMESRLEPHESVFGIDEHSAIVIDLELDTVKVTGNGTFSVRNQGRQTTFKTGDEIPLASLKDPQALFSERRNAPAAGNAPSMVGNGDSSEDNDKKTGLSPLLGIVQDARGSFEAALLEKDTDEAVKVILSLQSEIDLWQNETFQSDEMSQAKSALRTMIVRLGEFASKGVREPEEIFGPYVDLTLELRRKARNQKRWDESDLIRDELKRLGVEVRDIPGGSEWNSIGTE